MVMGRRMGGFANEFLKDPLCNISHLQMHTYFDHSSDYVFAKFDYCGN